MFTKLPTTDYVSWGREGGHLPIVTVHSHNQYRNHISEALLSAETVFYSSRGNTSFSVNNGIARRIWESDVLGSALELTAK
jgi:hypothetical protein